MKYQPERPYWQAFKVQGLGSVGQYTKLEISQENDATFVLCVQAQVEFDNVFINTTD